MHTTPMKMPSTYISLLVCGLMLIFYVNNSRQIHLQKQVLTPPSTKIIKPLVARLLPAIPANPDNNNGDHQLPIQTGHALSFFHVVLTFIAPEIKLTQ